MPAGGKLISSSSWWLPLPLIPTTMKNPTERTTHQHRTMRRNQSTSTSKANRRWRWSHTAHDDCLPQLLLQWQWRIQQRGQHNNKSKMRSSLPTLPRTTKWFQMKPRKLPKLKAINKVNYLSSRERKDMDSDSIIELDDSAMSDGDFKFVRIENVKPFRIPKSFKCNRIQTKVKLQRNGGRHRIRNA